MGWLIAGCVLFGILLLLLLPVSLRIRLTDRSPLDIRFCACHIPFLRFPKKEKPFREKDYSPRALRAKKRKAEKAAEKKARKAGKTEKQPSGKKKNGEKKPSGLQKFRLSLSGDSLTEQMAFITDIVGTVLKLTAKKARVTVRALGITVSTEDVGQTAVLYGAIGSCVSCLWECLNRFLKIRTPDKDRLYVNADFLSESMKIDFDISFQLRVGSILYLLLTALFRFFKYSKS